VFISSVKHVPPAAVLIQEKNEEYDELESKLRNSFE